MDLIYADLELVSPWDVDSVRKGLINKDEIRVEKVRALVDSGLI